MPIKRNIPDRDLIRDARESSYGGGGSSAHKVRRILEDDRLYDEPGLYGQEIKPGMPSVQRASPNDQSNVFRLILERGKFDTFHATNYKGSMFSKKAIELRNEFELSVSRKRDALVGIGCSPEMAEGVSGFQTLTSKIEDLRPAWAAIPRYADAKYNLISRDPAHHFDQFWRPYVEAGLLYQHILREYDDAFVSALAGHVLRKRDKMVSESYRIPTLKDYNNRLAGFLDSTFGEEVFRLARTVGARRPSEEDSPQAIAK